MTFTKFCGAISITAFVAVALVYNLINLLDDSKSSTKRAKPGEDPDESSSAVCPCCSSRIRLTKNS
jgi:hypothetical protein